MATASDNFNRTQNPLASGWTTATGAQNFRANGSAALSVGGGDSVVGWTADTFGNDHFSEVTIGAAADDGGPAVRLTLASNTFYLLDLTTGSANVELFIMPGAINIATVQFAAAMQAGDVYRLSITGSTMSILRNGAAPSVLGGSLTDVTYATGVPGMHASGTSLTYDSWQGGDVGGGASDTPRTPNAGSATLVGNAPTLVRGTVLMPQTPFARPRGMRRFFLPRLIPAFALPIGG